jgi:hypothetical protein
LVPLFLKRQRGRTLGGWADPDVRPRIEQRQLHFCEINPLALTFGFAAALQLLIGPWCGIDHNPNFCGQTDLQVI